MQLFPSKHFLTKIFMLLSKNNISRSAKQFREVNLDSWGQNLTYFFQAFFDKNFDAFVKKQPFAK
jgi:hypothetical protein